MRLPYDLIVFDLEAEQPSDEIIEIGAVKFLRDGNIHPVEFQTFVNIGAPLSEFIKNLTHITDNDLNVAPNFPQALEAFHSWSIEGSKNIVLCSWGCYDSSELRNNCAKHNVKFPFRGKSLDAKSIFVWMSAMFNQQKGSDGLSSALRRGGLEFQGTKHRAIDDARNTALLLKQLWKSYENNGRDLLKTLEKLGISK